MKVISQRLFPVVLNRPQEHIEIPVEGTLVRYCWNIGLDSQYDRFVGTTFHRIDQLYTIEVFSYGQRIGRYHSKWHQGWANMSSLKTKDGFELPVNDMTLRLTTAGTPRERKPRGHKGEPLLFPEKIAIQRLQ